jgi:hypothetical protein
MNSFVFACLIQGQLAIPVRSTTTLDSSAAGDLSNIADVRQLPNGRVLVNDRTRREVVVLGPSLQRVSVLIGSGAAAISRYGMATRLLAYGADSTVFVDPEARSLVVIGPAATSARITAPPDARDVLRMSTLSYGTAGFDPDGRLIYQGASKRPRRADPNAPSADPTKAVVSKGPVTGPIVHANFETRRIDTLAWLRLPFEETVAIRNATLAAYNPLPVSDDWTLLPDGTVAIVRAHDYHIDWIAPDGSMKSTAKMPFDWRSISPEEKEHIRDSLRSQYDAEIAKLPPQPKDQPFPPFTMVEASDLPDFYPPIRPGQVSADPDGNVWILPTTTRLPSDGLLYDVVNRQGQLFERVRLPAGRLLAGFGPSGAIFLRNVVDRSDERLERVTVNRP